MERKRLRDEIKKRSRSRSRLSSAEYENKYRSDNIYKNSQAKDFQEYRNHNSGSEKRERLQNGTKQRTNQSRNQDHSESPHSHSPKYNSDHYRNNVKREDRRHDHQDRYDRRRYERNERNHYEDKNYRSKQKNDDYRNGRNTLSKSRRDRSGSSENRGISNQYSQNEKSIPLNKQEDILAKIQKVTASIPQHSATKVDRELYVGNIPQGIQSQQLLELLNTALKTAKMNTQPGNPAINAWISNDGHYAFVEFRSIQEANNAFILNNVSLFGNQLKVNRPRTYAPGDKPANPLTVATKALGFDNFNQLNQALQQKLAIANEGRLIIGGLPHGFSQQTIRKAVEKIGQLKYFDMPKNPLTGLTKGYAIFLFAREDDNQRALNKPQLLVDNLIVTIQKVDSKNMPSIIPARIQNESSSGTQFQSRILLIQNMVKLSDLQNDDDFDDLYDDVKEECEKSGTVKSITIPRPVTHNTGIGNVFVEFLTIQEALKAKQNIQGKSFGGKKVECKFHPEELYRANNFVSD